MPSAEYKAYVDSVREPERRPFSPCSRYVQLPAGCGICRHSIEDVPCPDLTEEFQSIYDPEVIRCQPPDPNPTPCAAAATLEE